MVSKKSLKIRLKKVLNGRSSVRELYYWLMESTFDQQFDDVIDPNVSLLKLRFAEYTGGYLSSDDLMEQLQKILDGL